MTVTQRSLQSENDYCTRDIPRPAIPGGSPRLSGPRCVSPPRGGSPTHPPRTGQTSVVKERPTSTQKITLTSALAGFVERVRVGMGVAIKANVMGSV